MLIPIADVPRWYAERKPKDTVAIAMATDALTWDQLERGANRRARAFAAKGVKPGDFVAIGLPNSNAFFETSFRDLETRRDADLAVAGACPAAKPRRCSTSSSPLWWSAASRLECARSVPAGFRAGRRFGRAARPPDGAVLEGDDQRRLDRPAEGHPRSSAGGDRHRGRAAAADGSARVAAQSRPALSQRPLHPVPLRVVRRRSASPAWQSSMPKNTLRLIEAQRVQWVNFVPTMMHRIWSLPEAVATATTSPACRSCSTWPRQCRHG